MVIVPCSDDDVPPVKAITTAVGDDRALVDLAILGVPSERETIPATVNAGDLEVGYRHDGHDSLRSCA